MTFLPCRVYLWDNAGETRTLRDSSKSWAMDCFIYPRLYGKRRRSGYVTSRSYLCKHDSVCLPPMWQPSNGLHLRGRIFRARGSHRRRLSSVARTATGTRDTAHSLSQPASSDALVAVLVVDVVKKEITPLHPSARRTTRPQEAPLGCRSPSSHELD